MSPLRTINNLWQILPVALCCYVSVAIGADPVPNEINSHIAEPIINIPEADYTSPFHKASQSRTVSGDPLIAIAQEAVNSTRRRYLDTSVNSPWQMMHGLLALRQDFEVKHNEKIVSGLDWVSSGPVYEGEAWFEKTRYGGRAHPYSRPWAFEGHANQFLAILSMSALPVNHRFQTARGPITMGDMLEHAQKTVSTEDEPTWTLWALSRYLPPEASWRNEKGEPWSIERLVSIQTKKKVDGTACGGTHGLFALAHARNVYLQRGQPLRGVWLEAEYKIRQYIQTAQSQQNSDGMPSTNFFRGREYDKDFNDRMASAGHILEFLMIALPQNELNEPWVRKAIEAVARDLIDNRKAYVKCSPLYHAVNGLNIYLGRAEVRTAMAPAPATSQADPQSLPLTAPPQPSAPQPQLRRAGDGIGLKSVPVTRISRSKELPAPAEQSDSSGSGDVKNMPTEEVPVIPENAGGTKPAAGPTPAPAPATGPTDPETTDTPAVPAVDPAGEQNAFSLKIPMAINTESAVDDDDRAGDSKPNTRIGPTTSVPSVPTALPISVHDSKPATRKSGWKKKVAVVGNGELSTAPARLSNEESPIIEPPQPPSSN